MISPNLKWYYRVILSMMVLFTLIACASYPGGPRNPETEDDSYTLEEDTFLNVSADEGILVNDKAREGVNITLETTGEMETEAGGIVTIGPGGEFTYAPPLDFNGTDQVVYTIRNEKGKRKDGTIYLEVTPVNDRPQSTDDRAQTNEGQSVTIDVLGNDHDPDDDPLTVVRVGTPSSGEVRINRDGTLVYTPQANHSGDITFSYTISDGNGETDSATVFVTITNVDAGINVQPDNFTGLEDTPLTIRADELLANDSDLENGGPLTIIALGNVVEPGVEEDDQGSVRLNGINITYTPAADFSGSATFTYTVESQSGGTASATVTVTVTAVPDDPTISDIDDVEITQGESSEAIEFTIGDVDTELSALGVTASVGSANPVNLIPTDGGITIGSGMNAIRTITVTPDPSLSGTATIIVSVSDGQGTASTTFQVTVTAANTAPVVSAVADQTTTTNTSVTVNFTVQDDRTPTPELDISAVSSNTALIPDASIVLGGGGPNRSFEITPAADMSGSAVITISVSDGDLTTRVSFRVTVTAPVVNTPPTISDITNVPSTSVNTPLTVSFTIADAETDVSLLGLSPVSDNTDVVAASGFSFGGSGTDRSLTITPVADAVGSALITITVTDGGGLTDQSSFQFVVEDQSGGDGDTDTSTGSVTSLSMSGIVLLGSSLSSAVDTLSAADDIYSTPMSQILTVAAANGLLANDRGAELQTLTVIPVIQAELTLNADGSLTYSPPVGFTGRQTFDYTVTDGTSTADASVTFVVGGNQVPQAVTDEYVVSGSLLSISAAAGLLANDIDPDGQPLTVVSTGVYDTQYGGEVNLQPDGSFNYLSAPSFDGFDTFTYSVSDGEDIAIGIAVISVTP